MDYMIFLNAIAGATAFGAYYASMRKAGSPKWWAYANSSLAAFGGVYGLAGYFVYLMICFWFLKQDARAGWKVTG